MQFDLGDPVSVFYERKSSNFLIETRLDTLYFLFIGCKQIVLLCMMIMFGQTSVKLQHICSQSAGDSYLIDSFLE